jgi:hypothetical protein
MAVLSEPVVLRSAKAPVAVLLLPVALVANALAPVAVLLLPPQPRQAHRHAQFELLQSLPDTRERAQQELMLRVTLGEQVTSLQGFGVVEVEHAFARTRELCRQLGDTPQLFRVILGLWAFYVERAE